MTYIAVATQSQLTPTINLGPGPGNAWSNAEVTVMTITVNRTGYWWAAAGLEIYSGGGFNCTIRIRYAGTQQAVRTFYNPPSGTNGSGMICPSAPVLISNGQGITLTVVNDVAVASNYDGNKTQLAAGFVPTPSYPK